MTKQAEHSKPPTGLQSLLRSFVLVVTAAAATIAIYQFVSPGTAALDITVSGKIQTLNNSGTGDDLIEVRYGGETVADLFQGTIRVQNSGGLPIEDSALKRPIRIAMDQRLLSASIARTVPEGIEAGVRIDGAAALLTFDLLNPGDSIDIQIATDGDFGTPRVSARVVGVKPVRVEPFSDAAEVYRPFGFALPFWLTILGLVVVTLAGIVAAIGSVAFVYDTLDPVMVRLGGPHALADDAVMHAALRNVSRDLTRDFDRERRIDPVWDWFVDNAAIPGDVVQRFDEEPKRNPSAALRSALLSEIRRQARGWLTQAELKAFLGDLERDTQGDWDPDTLLRWSREELRRSQRSSMSRYFSGLEGPDVAASVALVAAIALTGMLLVSTWRMYL